MTDSDGLDFESVTGGVGGPHMLIDITATDQDSQTTAPANNVWLLVTINDLAEAPEFTNLPDSTSLSEQLTVGQDLITVVANDDDFGDTVTLSMSVSPVGGPFSFNAGCEYKDFSLERLQKDFRNWVPSTSKQCKVGEGRV